MTNKFDSMATPFADLHKIVSFRGPESFSVFDAQKLERRARAAEHALGDEKEKLRIAVDELKKFRNDMYANATMIDDVLTQICCVGK